MRLPVVLLAGLALSGCSVQGICDPDAGPIGTTRHPSGRSMVTPMPGVYATMPDTEAGAAVATGIVAVQFLVAIAWGDHCNP